MGMGWEVAESQCVYLSLHLAMAAAAAAVGQFCSALDTLLVADNMLTSIVVGKSWSSLAHLYCPWPHLLLFLLALIWGRPDSRTCSLQVLEERTPALETLDVQDNQLVAASELVRLRQYPRTAAACCPRLCWACSAGCACLLNDSFPASTRGLQCNLGQKLQLSELRIRGWFAAHFRGTPVPPHRCCISGSVGRATCCISTANMLLHRDCRGDCRK